MRKWVACGADWEIGDVLRWTEGIWHAKRRARKKAKLTRLGTRSVTGQVTASDAKGYAHLTVLKCEIIENRYGGTVEPLKKNTVIKRKRGTIARGGAEKLVEPDPPKRPKVVSRFAGAH